MENKEKIMESNEEQKTFTFLQDGLKEHGHADDAEFYSITLDEYHAGDQFTKNPYSSMGLNFLNTHWRKELMDSLWDHHCGYYYMQAFAFKTLHMQDAEGLTFELPKLLNLKGDLTKTIDYERFNYFGRLFSYAHFFIHSGEWKTEATSGATSVLLDLVQDIKDHKVNKLTPGMIGEGEYKNFSSGQKDNCKESIEVIDNLIGFVVAASLYVEGSEETVLNLESELRKVIEFINLLESRETKGENAKLYADMLREVNETLEYIRPKKETLDDVIDSFKVQVQDIIENMKKEDPEGFVEAEKKAKESLKINKDKK